MKNITKSSLLVLHDVFYFRGGAERYNTLLATALHADLSAHSFYPGAFHPVNDGGFQGNFFLFSRPYFHKYLRQILFRWDFFTKTSFLSQYSTVIFSNESLDAIGNCKEGTRKIFFAHSLPRFLFDLRDFYEKKIPFGFRWLYKIFRKYIEFRFFQNLKQVDEIWTNSLSLQDQIFRYTGRNSKIFYPPVDRTQFSPDISASKKYFLSFSKLSPNKRVDLVIRIFRDFPQFPLHVLYGENDSQKELCFSLAKGHPHITFECLSDNNELPQRIRQAYATVFIPKNEDFGMVSIESQACGVPVLGVAEGGLLETVIPQKTGILFSPENLEVDFRKYLHTLQIQELLDFSTDCRNFSQKFDFEDWKYQFFR